MAISNLSSLKQMISNITIKVMNDLTEQIYEILIKYVDKDIYDYYVPKIYERTFEFRNNAWLKEKAKQIVDTFQSGVFYDPNSMSIPTTSNNYAHGNYFFNIDRRERLAENLNNGGSYQDWDIRNPFKRKPFFDDTINKITQNWDDMVISTYKKYGLNVTKK